MYARTGGCGRVVRGHLFFDERYEILSETTHFLAIGSFSFFGLCLVFGFACFWAGFSFFFFLSLPTGRIRYVE